MIRRNASVLCRGLWKLHRIQGCRFAARDVERLQVASAGAALKDLLAKAEPKNTELRTQVSFHERLTEVETKNADHATTHELEISEQESRTDVIEHKPDNKVTWTRLSFLLHLFRDNKTHTQARGVKVVAADESSVAVVVMTSPSVLKMD